MTAMVPCYPGICLEGLRNYVRRTLVRRAFNSGSRFTSGMLRLRIRSADRSTVNVSKIKSCRGLWLVSSALNYGKSVPVYDMEQYRRNNITPPFIHINGTRRMDVSGQFYVQAVISPVKYPRYPMKMRLGWPRCRSARSGYTGLFISPSGISKLDCATTNTDTAERSISIVRESLQVFFCTRGLGILPGSTARG